MYGKDSGSKLGTHIDSLGDFNGDGIIDFAVGDSHEYSSGDKSYIITGRNEFSEVIDLSNIQGSDNIIRNVNDEISFYSIISSIGDVNGDGIDDYLIAESYYDSPDDVNKLYIVHGIQTSTKPESDCAS